MPLCNILIHGTITPAHNGTPPLGHVEVRADYPPDESTLPMLLGGPTRIGGAREDIRAKLLQASLNRSTPAGQELSALEDAESKAHAEVQGLTARLAQAESDRDEALRSGKPSAAQVQSVNDTFDALCHAKHHHRHVQGLRARAKAKYDSLVKDRVNDARLRLLREAQEESDRAKERARRALLDPLLDLVAADAQARYLADEEAVLGDLGLAPPPEPPPTSPGVARLSGPQGSRAPSGVELALARSSPPPRTPKRVVPSLPARGAIPEPGPAPQGA